jgi:hypothetical protein
MARMDPELLVRLYEHDPDRRREAESLVGRDQARAVKGAIGRFANFFAACSGGFDAGECGWSFEDVDFAYLRAPYLAGRQDADAAMGLLLEDFAQYATLRKPRRGEDATLVFDEFSAIAGGREAAIQLVERVRDAGCALYLSAQSADGLGMRPSSGGWSAPARAGCCCTPCPTRDPAPRRWRDREGGRADLAAGLGWADRQQLGPDRRTPQDRARGRAAGPRRRSLVHRPGPLRAPDGGAHDHQRRLPDTSPRHGGPGPVLAAHRGLARCPAPGSRRHRRAWRP